MRRVKQLLAWPVILAIFFFWWQTLERLGVDWAGTLGRARGREGFLLLALAGGLAFFALQAAIWRLIVSDLVAPVGWLRGLRLWALSNFGRYLPGAAWHLVGRVYLSKGAGVSRTTGALSVLLEQGLQLLTALLLFILTIPFWPSSSLVARFGWLVALVPLGLVVMHPRLFFPLVNWGLRRLRRAPLPPTLRYHDLLRYTALYLLAHGANALALVACVRALQGNWEHWPAVVGAGMVAWVAGVVNLLTPGGLGTREAVLSLALTALIGLDVTAAAALLWRAATLLTEALGVALVQGTWVASGQGAQSRKVEPWTAKLP